MCNKERNLWGAETSGRTAGPLTTPLVHRNLGDPGGFNQTQPHFLRMAGRVQLVDKITP